MPDWGKVTISRGPLGLQRSQVRPLCRLLVFTSYWAPYALTDISHRGGFLPNLPLGDRLRIRQGARSIGWWVLGLQGSITAV